MVIKVPLPQKTIHQLLRHKESSPPLQTPRNREYKFQSIAPQPPSIFSFYSDIPQHHRLKWLQYSANNSNSQSSIQQHLLQGDSLKNDCFGATNENIWYKCEQHPWVSDKDFSTRFVGAKEDGEKMSKQVIMREI